MGSIPTVSYQKEAPLKEVLLFGAGDRDRTGTLFTARDFKSLVSAYSTTPALLLVMIAQFPPAVKDFKL